MWPSFLGRGVSSGHAVCPQPWGRFANASCTFEAQPAATAIVVITTLQCFKIFPTDSTGVGISVKTPTTARERGQGMQHYPLGIRI